MNATNFFQVMFYRIAFKKVVLSEVCVALGNCYKELSRVDSLEKTLMLGGIGGRRRRGTTKDEMPG